MITMHPGEYLAEIAGGLGYTNQTEIAEEMGVSQSVVSMLMTGDKDVTVKTALRLEKATGRSAESWMAMQLDYDRSKEVRHVARR